MPRTQSREHKERGASRAFLRQVEKNALALREKAGIGLLERLDPFKLTHELGIVIRSPEELSLTEREVQQLKQISARTWSGGAQRLPDGRLHILLNPNQTPERAAVTIMEEVAHAHLGHEPSVLAPDSSGITGRTYSEDEEKEAYWTGAAALLPSLVVARAVWEGRAAETIAAKFGTSIELANFRINVLRLAPHHRAHLAAA